MTTNADRAAVEAAVLDEFSSYWRANYHDGCVISNREWHLPRLQRAIVRALRIAMPDREVPHE